MIDLSQVSTAELIIELERREILSVKWNPEEIIAGLDLAPGVDAILPLLPHRAEEHVTGRGIMRHLVVKMSERSLDILTDRYGCSRELDLG